MGKHEPIRILATAALVAAVAFPQGMALAAEKGDLSEHSVKVISDYAMATIPSEIRQSDGSVLKIDKSDSSKIRIPYEDAKRVIKVAYMSAKAQECNMPDVQTQNYLQLKHAEQRKKHWSKQQLLFINRLHLFTVMWLTGNVRVVDKSGKPDSQPTTQSEMVAAARKVKQRTCTEEEKAKIRTNIDSFWKSAQK
jgi:hypothetical protein